MTDFSTIAPSYRMNSLVQASAGEMLLALLDPHGNEDILDVGCGAGNLTAALRARTGGRVVGIDQTAAMLGEAQQVYGDLGIEFLPVVGAALPFAEEFDCIFCNSVFQWFAEPTANLAAFHDALRAGGRVAVQAPATRDYCANFLKAVDHCRQMPELAACFAGFRSPWFFLDTAAAYRALFRESGFRVDVCRIDAVRMPCTVDKAVAVFQSGAAAGYCNQNCFDTPLPQGFADRVLGRVRESFAAQAEPDGRIELVFQRLFVLAAKEGEGK